METHADIRKPKRQMVNNGKAYLKQKKKEKILVL